MSRGFSEYSESSFFFPFSKKPIPESLIAPQHHQHSASEITLHRMSDIRGMGKHTTHGIEQVEMDFT